MGAAASHQASSGAAHVGRALEDLMACPNCDALFTARQPALGQKAVCHRCHTTLISPKRKAGMKIIALSLTVFVLVLAALFFPFLEISASGFGNHATILDSATTFSSVRMAALGFAVALMIIVIPLVRTILILYVLVPVVTNRPPYPHARRVFRLTQELKPWAMAEIFALGVAVALVKVADLATISFGPAFWMFAVLVGLVIFHDNYLCTWSVWKSLEIKRQ